MPTAECHVSVDIEADGPVPQLHSMLSLGAIALDADGQEFASFSVNLETLPGATMDPRTKKWWRTQPAAWAACRANLEAPETALPRFAEWLEALPGKPVFVGYPASFDFMFVVWYLHRFAGRNPFGWGALDLKSYAMAKLNVPFRAVAKRTMPPAWFAACAPGHTHIALEDAREQARLWRAMRLGVSSGS
jgi:hypothetical protein